MRIGIDGTIDCQEKCAYFPFLNFGYSCGLCSPIPTRAPSFTAAPALAPSLAVAPVVAPVAAPIEVPPGPDSESYEITIDLVGSTSILSTSDKQAFADAAGRWESIIKSGLADIPKSAIAEAPRFTGCEYPTIIDDVYLCVRVAKDDGVGGTLGYASPTHRRSSDGLPPH